MNEAMNINVFHLAPWIVFFPVIGLLVNLAVGRWLGERAIGAVASLAVVLSFMVSILLGVGLWAGHGHTEIVRLGEWIAIGSLQLDWAFRVDTLSVTMMLVVSGVGALIHVYAIGYMREDVRIKGDPGRFGRFFVFLNLFIAMMMLLVSADNYLMLFVGWEGVGLCSFLLIGFWHELDTLGRLSWANSDAAKKAFITNRIGDFGFLVAGMLIFWRLGSLQFDAAFEAAPGLASVSPGVVLAIALFLLLGVAGKSAQIPLHVWLPDAMAGPTPVSALIHAATMVTAGVYLIARSAPLYTLVPEAQTAVALTGAVTAMFAATIAVAQNDIKKVLAYSTISQLGFMVAAVGMGAYVAGMFHLVTHAFFKALLFLSAGSVILGLERGHHHTAHGSPKSPDFGVQRQESLDSQQPFDPGDMRNMGGLRTKMPVTFWVYLAGALALAGIVPFAGFWSKDEILLDASLHFPAVYWMLTAAAFLTAFYMARQVWMVFFGNPRHAAAEHAEESPAVITVPLVVLAVLSALGGALNLPGLHSLTHWLEYTLGELEAGFSWGVAGLSTLLALAGIALAWTLYSKRDQAGAWTDPLQPLLGPVFTLFSRRWYVDEGLQAILLNGYKALARLLAEVVDERFWHDWFHDTLIVGGWNWLSQVALDRAVDQRGIDAFANGLGAATQRLAAGLRRLQNGFVRSYALAVMLGVVLILGYLLLK